MPAFLPFAATARRCLDRLAAVLSPAIAIAIALLLALFAVGAANAQVKSGATIPVAEQPSPNLAPPPPDDPEPEPEDYARVVGMSAPTSMMAGSTAYVTVTMGNTGTTTWSSAFYDQYRLGLFNPLGSPIWGVSQVPLTNNVLPNAEFTFGFTITAPPTPGTYSFDWRMQRKSGVWFGATAVRTITVTPVPVYDAQQTGAIVPATMTAGGTYNVSLTFKNTGNVTWNRSENYRIGSTNPVDNVIFGFNRFDMNVDSVAPGQTANFSFQVRAPANPGNYVFDWGMLWEYHFRFGQTSAMPVTVIAAPVKPRITVTRNLSPIAGQSFKTTWSTTDASSLTHVCTASGTGYTVNETLAVNGTRTETAQAAWVGHPSSCTWTASGAGGTATHVETMTTLPAFSGVTYIHTDGLGSPVARTNAVGEVLSRTRYEAYGQAAEGMAQTIGFTGHVNDADTGLTYMQQRYYDPVAGRFLSIDPVTTDANSGKSFNRYAYANNSPYRYIDPDGRDAADRAYGAGVALAGLSAHDQAIWMAGERAATTEGSRAVSGFTAMQGTIAAVATPNLTLSGVAARVLPALGMSVLARGKLPGVPKGPGSVPKSERDPKRLFTPSERETKRGEQGNKCANGCGTTIDSSNSAGHHVERHADGGKTTSSNHAEVCTDCHVKIHAKEPQ